MKKGKKRSISLFLASTLFALCLTSCGNSTNGTETTQPDETVLSTAESTVEQEEQQAADTLFEDTFEFSVLAPIWSPYSADTNLIPEIERLTNTKINIEWAVQEDFDTKVNALISAGDLPDVIIGANTVNLVDQGAILPLDEYYTEEYAPNIVASLNQDDYARIRNVNDGHIYTLIELFDFPPVSSWMLRSDWLEALNMEVPTDWDGWLELWRAVRDNDVNGDGDASNEIPIAGDQFQLMPSFGILPDSNNYFCVMPETSCQGLFNQIHKKATKKVPEALPCS